MGEGNVSYKSIDGVLFNKSGTELTLFPTGRTEYVIPDGTLSVGMSAFAYAQHLLSVTIRMAYTQFIPGHSCTVQICRRYIA